VAYFISLLREKRKSYEDMFLKSNISKPSNSSSNEMSQAGNLQIHQTINNTADTSLGNTLYSYKKGKKI